MSRSLKNADLMNRVRGALQLIAPVGLQIGRRRNEPFPTVERNGMKVQCLRDWPCDGNFYTQWRTLIANHPMGQTFQSALWQQAVVDHFVLRNQFRLFVVFRGDALKAVLPLGFASNGLLETPGRYVSDFLDPIFDPTDAPASWEAILELLAKLWDWSASGLVLANQRSNASTRTILPTLAQKFGFSFEEEVASTISRIPLAPTWEKYLETLDSHDRKEFRRKVRNAVTKGNAQLTPCASLEQINTGLQCALENMELAEKQSKAKFVERTLGPYLLRCGPRLYEAGLLQLLTLRIEDKPAASLLLLNSPNGPLAYNTSYDQNLKHWSPGAVLFGLAIQRAIEQKAQTFELLRGKEEYKARMGAVMEPIYKLTLRR